MDANLIATSGWAWAVARLASARAARHGRALLPLGRLPLPYLFPASLLLAWHVAAARGWVAPQILPAPARVLDALAALARSGELWEHLGASLRRVGLAFGIATPAGIAAGILLGRSRAGEALLAPLFKAYAHTPVVAWVPLGILLFGIEERLLVALVASAAVVPVVLATWKAIRRIPREYLELARVHGYGGVRLVARVIAPATLPPVFVGLRQGVSQAWLTLVAAELIGTTEGMGYLVVEARELFQLDVVLAAIVVLGATGLVIDRALAAVEARFVTWQPRRA